MKDAVKQLVVRFTKRHPALVAFVVSASIIATIVYVLIDGSKPHPWIAEAPELNALDLRGHRPRALWRDDEFECLGWRATFGCDPFGPRDVSRDRACDAPLPRVSGYCAVRNATSGEVFHVMLATCTSWRWWLVESLTCNDARNFTDFSIRSATYTHPPPERPPALPLHSATASPPASMARGVVLVAYPKVVAGVYAIVRLLRFLGCALPVEVWLDPREMAATHSILRELVAHHNVFVRTIADPQMTKFMAKPYAIYHSAFESVLFLDSDNIPAKDPTYLFDTPEFVRTGAMFWPDFWRPAPGTVFNVQPQSALWQLLDMPFVDMFEQESGQVLINKTASTKALDKLMFFATDAPRLLTDWELVYGDKDLFRLAWLNTSQPFHFVQHVLALGGLYDSDADFFCGVAMIQRDPQGDIVFMHRNQAKLSGRRDQRVLLTHFQKFTGGDATALTRDLLKYRIQCKVRRLGQDVCFRINPRAPAGGATPLLVKSLEGTKYPQVEKQAIHFSIEGRSLLTPAEEAEIATIEAGKLAKRTADDEDAAAKTAKNALASQTRYTQLLCGALVSIGVLWKWHAHRKRQQRARDSGGSTNSSSSNGAKRPTLGSTDVALDIAGSSAAVRRKKSLSVQFDDQHIL